jgi:hypothetical protein
VPRPFGLPGSDGPLPGPAPGFTGRAEGEPPPGGELP